MKLHQARFRYNQRKRTCGGVYKRHYRSKIVQLKILRDYSGVYKSHDSSKENRSLKGFIGALINVFVGVFVGSINNTQDPLKKRKKKTKIHLKKNQHTYTQHYH